MPIVNYFVPLRPIMNQSKRDIRAFTKEELRRIFEENGDQAFRGNQVYEWLWQKGVHSFEAMTNLPKATREMLDKHFVINHIKVDVMQRSDDGTIKNAVRLHDGLLVESVLIPTDTRTTACVSSQVGCSLNCSFCATARLKPKLIKKMADDEVKFKLAVSLHSAIDSVRTSIMPYNEQFPLSELREALQYWYQKTKNRITYEYVVWKGINDQRKDVEALIKFCKFAPSKVNLIEYNPIDDGQFQQADSRALTLYQTMLEEAGITVTVRHSRGKDIDAACGQLANKTTKN